MGKGLQAQDGALRAPHPHPDPFTEEPACPSGSGGDEQCSSKPRLHPLSRGTEEDGGSIGGSAPSPSRGEGWGGGDARTQRARTLRSNPTDAERRLWQGLRGRQMDGFKFRRQMPLGPYIVDFVCLEARLVIEVDGGQHQGSQKDQARDAWLTAEGYRVLRFWDHEVLGRTTELLERIWDALHPHPGLPPSRGKERIGGRPGGCGPSPSRGEGSIPAPSISMGEGSMPAPSPSMGEGSIPAPSPSRGEGWGGGEVGAADHDQ